EGAESTDIANCVVDSPAARDCGCAVAADAPAAPGCGLPRPRDGQEDRSRPASLHPPAAPEITTIYY
ncbi:MAG: hypothetical protein II007_05300, partial [Gammaproteobacteria bacterium]|nr:hypothetical protein [Gammaproteobacteria bacterium]